MAMDPGLPQPALRITRWIAGFLAGQLAGGLTGISVFFFGSAAIGLVLNPLFEPADVAKYVPVVYGFGLVVCFFIALVGLPFYLLGSFMFGARSNRFWVLAGIAACWAGLILIVLYLDGGFTADDLRLNAIFLPSIVIGGGLAGYLFRRIALRGSLPA